MLVWALEESELDEAADDLERFGVVASCVVGAQVEVGSLPVAKESTKTPKESVSLKSTPSTEMAVKMLIF